MEDALLQRIKKKLILLGEDYDSQKPFMKKWLHKVEVSILAKEHAHEKGVQLLKDAKFSVKSIAEELCCSRTTLYNHEQILKRYIEISIHDFEDGSYKEQIKAAKVEIQRLRKMVELMEVRDVDIERMKFENKQITEKLWAAKEDNQKLLVRLTTLSNENKLLKEKITSFV